jgi:FkbM family methyltransferase
MNLMKAFKAALRPSYWPALMRIVVPTIEHGPALAGIHPATIIDVGGNKGQFAFFASRRWPSAIMHVFEPLPAPFAKLKTVMAGRATLHRCALGATDTEAEIHIASRADSSSLLPLGEEQSRIFGVESVATLRVPVHRLDTLLSEKNVTAPALLKIDVQGFEYEVLQGMGSLSSLIRWIYLEVSFVELYTGQKLFGELDILLRSLGYKLHSRHNMHRSPDGEEVQADLLYIRDAAQ